MRRGSRLVKQTYFCSLLPGNLTLRIVEAEVILVPVRGELTAEMKISYVSFVITCALATPQLTIRPIHTLPQFLFRAQFNTEINWKRSIALAAQLLNLGKCLRGVFPTGQTYARFITKF